ncbi:hypothetical protein PFICI_08596 [Pestalotiopsis fici W106-1]|uniref:DUF2293 domain-containing protein n=1 Tax=Pestalotiopsis fici (strain W106-1 / CGMCC3.15140) TaxID=1229662 RepID=W3WY14_PESFW|nr:uncharacterized protein PFICI_08596 [Pestalotiopsis fici W106-1]ETS78743.1 hypothetical protein PFICI_08596 [Pestalotiopsis fici W106-1]
MGRESRKLALPAIGKHAKARHNKMDRMAQADPSIYSTLNALKQAPAPKLKHKSYFEIAENADKKDKILETQTTAKRTPPPGYEFIALGNPELTQMCKDISREQDAMIFIVSESTDESVHSHTHRLGYHFRERIVDQARDSLTASGVIMPQKIASGRPESIPKDRNQILKEADAVLRDLFPRIPNSNRIDILRHSFDKDNKFFNGREKVGMAGDLPLSRRVQLAALSHIRHTMTRYDDLLREGQKWENARKAVEQPCLDIIVKWRGDEETGRDQLDEILREVIEISDDEDSDEDSTEEEQVPAAARLAVPSDPGPNAAEAHALAQNPPAPSRASSARSPRHQPLVISLVSPAPPRKLTRKERKAARQTQQRFKRYEQVAETFRRVPGSPRSPRDKYASGSLPEMATVSVPRNLEYVREPERTVPQSAAPTLSGSYTRQDVPPIASRSRGQSPILVRVADSNMPKVGQAANRLDYSPHAMSPVRSQFQDLLVRSIEPHSPGASQIRDRATSYPFHPEMGRVAEAPRVVDRSVVPRPDGPTASTVFLGPEELPSSRRQVSTRFTEQPELFSGAGFIQVHREPSRRVPSQARPDGLAISHAIPVTRSFERRSRSPISHPQAGAYRDAGRVLYRSRPTTVYVDEPRSNGRDEFALSSRDHPIVLDDLNPRATNRSTDAHRSLQDMEYDPRQPGEVDFLRRVPVREPDRRLDRPAVTYTDVYDSRPTRVLQQPAEPPHSHLIPVRSHIGHHPEPLPYGADVFRPAHTSRPFLDSASHHAIRGSAVDAYVPVERVLPPQARHEPHYPDELAYGYQRPQERIIVRDPGRDQAFIQQPPPGPDYTYRPVPNHY